MIAPGHDEVDHRVNRAFGLASSIASESVMYFENDRVSSNFKYTSNRKAFSPISIFDILFLKKRIINTELIQEILRSDICYIHDSGLYGIFLIRYINHYSPNKKIIFDYHDFLDWEILHHISKFVSKPIIKKIFFYLVATAIKKIFMPQIEIYSIYGISNAQILNFTKHLTQKPKYSQIIPNSRPYLDEFFLLKNKSSICNLVWIGNIGANRSIEMVQEYTNIAKIRFKEFDFRISTIGKKWGNSNNLHLNIEQLGSYKNDAEILNLLPQHMNVGVFFGWDDPYQLGINEIASPNKLYSYINIGIPFLIPLNLENIITTHNIDDCFIFTNKEDFSFKLHSIICNYDEYCNKVRQLKKVVPWDHTIEAYFSSSLRQAFN